MSKNDTETRLAALEARIAELEHLMDRCLRRGDFVKLEARLANLERLQRSDMGLVRERVGKLERLAADRWTETVESLDCPGPGWHEVERVFPPKPWETPGIRLWRRPAGGIVPE